MEERQQKWLKRTRRFTRALSLWQQARIESFPDLLWLALVLRGFHDDFYKKNTTPESSWNETRNQRSYEDVLRPHLGARQCPSAILDRQYTLQFCRIGRSRSQKNGVERQTSLRALLSLRTNWEDTDRATLLLDQVAEKVAVRRGARRECILTLARFSSAELNRRVLVALEGSTSVSLTQWRRCLEDVVAGSRHVSDLLQASFNLAERNTVARKSKASAQEWTHEALSRCQWCSGQFGVIGSGEKQAALLMATFGPLTAKNIQSAMWRHAFTSEKLVLVGPGATKLLVQLVGLYRDFRPSGVSMATAWQLHDLLGQAQKAMKRATKRFTELLPHAPQLAERLVLWAQEDKSLQNLMRIQFHCCETNKLLRAVFQAVQEAQEEDDEA